MEPHGSPLDGINWSLTDRERRKLVAAFGFFDLHGTGRLSCCELEAALIDTGVCRGDVSALLEERDLNGDGELDVDEFSGLMCQAGLQAALRRLVEAHNPQPTDHVATLDGRMASVPLKAAPIQQHHAHLNSDRGNLILTPKAGPHRRPSLLSVMRHDQEMKALHEAIGRRTHSPS